jgi:hypothetical protein
LPVDLCPVPTVPNDLRLEQQRPPLAFTLGAYEGTLRTDADQRLVRRSTERVERRQVGDRFQQVGLAVAVGAEDRGQPFVEGDLGRLVAPEIGEPEPAEVHGTR